MHDCNDEKGIASDLVNDPVRESVGRAAAGSPRQQRPCLRVLQDAVDGALHFRRKLVPESRSLGLVVPDGFRELDAGGDEKFNVHSLCRLPISSKTSLAAIVGISPRSKASSRSSAS